jgi:hypothetical protein
VRRTVVIYKRFKQRRDKRRGHHDDKVEEIWLTALSNAYDRRNVFLPDGTTRTRGKSTIKLLSKVSEPILSMRWHHYSLLQDL